MGLYEVLGPLGAGGMGEVYRARDTRLEREVALKILPHDFAHDVERRRRFEREARLLASLNHPAIAALHGLEETDGILCLEAIAAVLEREPDWDALPTATTPIIRKLLRRCLEKDKARRLHDIGDARLEIEEAQVELSSGSTAAAAAAPVSTSGRRMWLWTAGLLAAGAAGGGLIAFLALRLPRDAAITAKRLTLAPPPRVRLPESTSSSVQHLAVSPDGTRVAFMGSVEGEGTKLYMRLESAEAPVAIADVPEEGDLRGASWGPGRTIVFSPGPYEGLWRVSAEGGEPRLLTSPDAQQEEVSHRWPRRVPFVKAAYDVAAGSRGFVFVELLPDVQAPTRLVLIPDWARELRGSS